MGKGREQRKIFYIALIFIVLATMYFMPKATLLEALPEKVVQFRIAYPVAVLALFGAYLGLSWQFVLAFLFSCTGDAMGAYGSFIGQMGYFALAHVMLIWGFASRLHGFRKYAATAAATDKSCTVKGHKNAAAPDFWSSTTWKVLVCLTVAAALAFAFSLIIPKAPAGTIRIGCSIYSLLIGTMTGLALMQRSPLFAVGAVLFLISDMILSWNKFVSPVAASKWLIMVPYYLGQLLIWLGAVKTKAENRAE